MTGMQKNFFPERRYNYYFVFNSPLWADKMVLKVDSYSAT